MIVWFPLPADLGVHVSSLEIKEHFFLVYHYDGQSKLRSYNLMLLKICSVVESYMK